MIDRKEIRRQILHIIIGSLFLVFLYFEWLTPWVLLGLIIAFAIISYMSTKMKIPVVYSLIEKYERPYDSKNFPGRGPLLMLVGILLAIKLFPRDIALASVAILVFGDSVSHLIGAHWGKIKSPLNRNGPKLMEGTIAGTIAGALAAIGFVGPIEALFGAAGAMIVESFEFEMNKRPVDDNLVVPLVAGALMLIIRSLF